METLQQNAERLVRDLQLKGTVYELLIKHPGGWLDAEKLKDSPALMRYASDLRQALVRAGWQPRLPATTRKRMKRKTKPSGGGGV